MDTTQRHGSKTFYKLIDEAIITHDAKSHDYASNDNPYANYHFAGLLANLFAHSSQDAGFIGRIGEKIYRLSNLEKAGKQPKNESIEDTEKDIVVLALLWMADRRDRRDSFKTITPIESDNYYQPNQSLHDAIWAKTEKGAPPNEMKDTPKFDTTDGQIIHMLINRQPMRVLKQLAAYLNTVTKD